MASSPEPISSSSYITICNDHEDASFSAVHLTDLDKDALNCGEMFPPVNFESKARKAPPLSLRTNNLPHHLTQNPARSASSRSPRKFHTLRITRETAKPARQPPSAFCTRIYRPIEDDPTKLPWIMEDAVVLPPPGTKPPLSFGTMCSPCTTRSLEMQGSTATLQLSATSTYRWTDKLPLSGEPSYPLTPTTSTEALDSLVWTGDHSASLPARSNTLPRYKTRKDHLRSSTTLFESFDDGDIHQPASALDSPMVPSASQSSLCRHSSYDPNPLNYRHSIAMTITNDKLSEEMLLSELELMRERDDLWHGESENRPWNTDFIWSGCSESLDAKNMDQSIPYDPPPSPNSSIMPPEYRLLGPSPTSQGPSPSWTWTIARRALFICRELVLTERDYLSSLRMLLSGETFSPPPALMLMYLPPLVHASEAFTALIEKNPSAQGVADAFLLCQADMEAAFVGWCGIVGSFFIGEDQNTDNGGADSENPMSSVRLKRRMSSLGRLMSLYISPNGNVSAGYPEPVVSSRERRRKRRPGIRDLAIRPSQRVTRYVLLFEDLLEHTPTSLPCRSAVECALQSAIVIAQKSNKAQENASFVNPSFKS
ncbi:hypothetical protein Hypma_016074 [Hypsizygus marmoreus]|uniref:DH domain-containing protein n=1 Tax=Hypsizygus marmoreus TaxID=39966 RepID=A0A369K6T9_HYPMA|nr:hypothetical protein Hypma_016074 [Hypsizygus marmoreus]